MTRRQNTFLLITFTFLLKCSSRMPPKRQHGEDKANVPAPKKKKIYPRYGEYLLNHYFTKEISEKTSAPRYKVAQYRKQISLKNLKDAPQTPDLLLGEIIRYLIDNVRSDKHREFGYIPAKFSVVFRSSALQSPISIGYRGFDQNTPEVNQTHIKREKRLCFSSS